MNTKNLLIGLGIGCAVVFLASVGLAFAVARHLTATPPKPEALPSALAKASVRVGSGLLTKTVFAHNPALGTVSDIVVQSSSGKQPSIAIAGSEAAAFADVKGSLGTPIRFSDRGDRVSIVDTNGDGVFEYLNCGSWISDVILFDHKGSVIWRYGGSPGVDDAAAGDIDGDGVMEYVVGFNGGGGVSELDKNGKLAWNQPDGNVWHVEMVDTNGDGQLDIVHSNAAGTLTVRDARGSVISRKTTAAYLSHFSLCKWPGRSGRPAVLSTSQNHLLVSDFGGRTMAQLRAPGCDEIRGDAWGAYVKLKPRQPDYFAAIVEFENWNRSMLCVYDWHSRLVYQEILPENCAAIEALPVETDREALLVGGKGKIWKYVAAPTQP